MKFERVDDKTVKCFLSNEELEEYDIDYQDFLTRSEKARELVQEIMQQATEEVGYKPPKYAFDLQIMIMPDHGMMLTFSEKDPFEGKGGEQLMSYLRELRRILTEKKDQPFAQQGETANAAGQQKKELPKPEIAVFCFRMLGTVMEYAAALPGNLRIQSSLYKLDDMYYLVMCKAGASYERYSKACIQAMEFGQLCAADEERLKYLAEHAECLISEKAVKKLAVQAKPSSACPPAAEKKST